MTRAREVRLAVFTTTLDIASLWVTGFDWQTDDKITQPGTATNPAM